MPLVSRKGILAIAAVIDVAIHARGRPVSAKALAARHKLPPRHLEPVLQALVRDGILKGVRGPHGGYELAREHKRITAEDILRAAGSAEGGRRAAAARIRAGQRRGAAGAGRSRAHLLRGARPDQCRGHGEAGSRAQIAQALLAHDLIRKPVATFRDHALSAPVHGLDSFGASPRGGKVQRFVDGVADAVPHPWGKPECRRQSGRRTRGCVLVRGGADSSPPS